VNAGFWRTFKKVAAIHVSVVVVLMCAGLFRGCRRAKPDFVQPIAFMVEVPASPGPVRHERPEPVPIPKPTPRPQPKPTPKPAEKPAPQPQAKPKIEKSTQMTVRGTADRPPRPLTEEEIRLLMQGALPGNRTVVPANEEQRCLALIHAAMHEAWVQPTREEAAGAVAEVGIRLGPAGEVTGRFLAKASGNQFFDQTVMTAANAVRRIPGLTPGFTERHPVVTISFRLE